MSMKVVVCIKQVPDTGEVRIDPETGNLIREGVPSIVNPDDKHAVEEAVVLKEKYGGKVTVITMGPRQADAALRECLAMGADEAILLSDKAFSGADTSATSYTLGSAIKKLGEFDLILCGRQALDGNTAQVGPQLAEFLKVPQVTYARKIEITGGGLKVERALEDGYEIVETKLPALVTATKDLNIPRIPPMDAIMDAYGQKEIITWTASDIEVERDKIGIKGSPTRIRKASTPVLKKGQIEIIDGTVEEAVDALVVRLKGKQLI
jgi:electron transfer flavoprotein beta subunit